MKKIKIRLSKKTYQSMDSYLNMFNLPYYANKNLDIIEPVIYGETQKLLENNKIKLL